MGKKVKFNIQNAHYALLTRNAETGAITYGTPVAVPGSVSLSLDIDGDQDIFWADGIKYYIDNTNRGYTGDWVLAYITEKMRKELLQEIQDSTDVLFEVQETGEPVEFAFGFQIDGNENSTRFWFYDVTAQRPNIEANTTEGSNTPQTDTLNLTMTGAQVKSGDTKHYVRGRLDSDSTDGATTYSGWFSAVVTPGTFSSGTQTQTSNTQTSNP